MTTLYCAYAGAPLEKDSEVVCSILDVDFIEYCLILSRNPSIVSPLAPSLNSASPITTSKMKEKKKLLKSTAIIEEVGLSPGSSVVGVVEHKTPYYLVLSCSTLTGCKLAYGLMDTVS